MPNRDGLNTAGHPNRNVSKTPYGYEAHHERSSFQPGMSRLQAFEDIERYTAGPFRTERRADIAAQAMGNRDEEGLSQYYQGGVQIEHNTGRDDI